MWKAILDTCKIVWKFLRQTDLERQLSSARSPQEIDRILRDTTRIGGW